MPALTRNVAALYFFVSLDLSSTASTLTSVSHLLHMTFLPELYGSLCHPCFVNPAMSSPPRLRSQWEVFLQDVGLVLGRYVRPRGHGHTVQLSFSPRIQ
jgi:hypothetical protein